MLLKKRKYFIFYEFFLGFRTYKKKINVGKKKRKDEK